MPNLHLSVDKVAFYESLRYLSKFIKKRAGLSDLFWAYEDSNLILEFESASSRAQAKGDWSGQVRCSPLVIRLILAGLNTGDPIEIHSDTNRLVVGSQSFDCKWDETRGQPKTLSKQKRDTYSPYQNEVRQMLDHVYYEIQQSINLLRLYNQSLPHSTSDETARQTLDNAKLESLLIHSRILLDFFEISAAQRHLNDALCEDYGFPARHINISEQDRTRINKEVTHLTYSRPPLTASDQDRGWKLNILMPLLERCDEFIEFIVQNFPAGQSKYSREDWIGLGRGTK